MLRYQCWHVKDTEFCKYYLEIEKPEKTWFFKSLFFHSGIEMVLLFDMAVNMNGKMNSSNDDGFYCTQI